MRVVTKAKGLLHEKLSQLSYVGEDGTEPLGAQSKRTILIG